MPKKGPRRGNNEGSIYKRFDKDGKLTGWAAQYTDYTDKKRYLYAKTRTEVLQKLKEALRNNDDGVVIDGKKIKFADWIAEWLEVYVRPNVKQTTYTSYHYQIHDHIIPAFPRVLLKDVRTETIQKYLNSLEHGRKDGKDGAYSQSLASAISIRIYSSLEKAVDLGYIIKNPAKQTKPPKMSGKPEKEIYTKEEQKKFEEEILSHLPKRYNDCMFLIALHTGLRVGEVMGLKLDDIDFESNELAVARTLSVIYVPGTEGATVAFTPPKTASGRRIIPMSPLVVELFKIVIEGRKDVEKNVDTEYVRDGLVFLTSTGNFYDHRYVLTKERNVARRAGVKYIGFHGLRHTFATRWIEQGLDVKTLADILGHSDAKVTLNIYTHSLQDQKRESMKKFSDTLGTKLEI